MYATAQKVVELRQLGIEVPLRPKPPFNELPSNATDSERQADAAYQAECLLWIKTVAEIYCQHFPNHSGKRD